MKKNPNAPWELYNLKEDSKEVNNLVVEHPEIIQKMNEIVKKEHQHPHVKEWEFIDSKLK